MKLFQIQDQLLYIDGIVHYMTIFTANMNMLAMKENSKSNSKNGFETNNF